MVFLHHVIPCVAYANWRESYYAAVLDTWRMKSSGFLTRSLTNYTSEIVIFTNIFYILSRWDTREEFWLLFLLLILFSCRHNNREYKQFDKSSFSSIKIVTRTYWNGPVPHVSESPELQHLNGNGMVEHGSTPHDSAFISMDFSYFSRYWRMLESQKCRNTRGSYKCVCDEGLYWIDNKCQGKKI